MIEIRIHGRGGQGAVTAADLIAASAFQDGKCAQAFPSFGVERRGAPIEAFARIDTKPIRTRIQVYCPNYVLILDETLLDAIDPACGCNNKTTVIINTQKTATEIKKQHPCLKNVRLKTLPATQIALKTLGKPIINTVMLGAFACISNLIKPESLQKAIKERFNGDLAQKNILAMNTAYCASDGKTEYCQKLTSIKLDMHDRFAVST